MTFPRIISKFLPGTGVMRRPIAISAGFFPALLTAALVLTSSPALAQDGSPNLLGRYGDWMAYSASPGAGKVCFAIARPTRSETNPPAASAIRP